MKRILILFTALLAAPAYPHDSWISRDGLRNAAGEWCCGKGDCFVITDPQHRVRVKEDGYHIIVDTVVGGKDKRIFERVPFSEAQRSPDGAYWRCQRPDGSRRCFFAPPPNT